MPTIKPYLYGGIALLIVGLFSYSLILKINLQAAEQLASDRLAAIDELTAANKDLLESSARKAGAAAAYIAMTDYVASLSKGAIQVFSTYKSRSTNDEKCLDLSPPSLLIERLRENSIQGQDNTRGTK